MRLRSASPCAAQDLRLAFRLGDRHDRFAVRLGAYAGRELRALGAKLRRFRQALRLHAFEGLLRDLGQEIGALDAHVDDIDADLCGERAQLLAHLYHHVAALLGERRLEAALAVDAAKRGVEPRAHVLARDFEAAGHVLAEFPRVGDLEGDEGVDDVAAPVAHLHADVLEIEAEQPVLDDLDRVARTRRDLEVDARLPDDAGDLAEAEHQSLLARVDDEDRRIDQEHRRPAGRSERRKNASLRCSLGRKRRHALADRRARRGGRDGGGGPIAAAQQLIERQIGQHARPRRALQDDLVGALEDALDRFEIEPLAGHVLGAVVFPQHRQEAFDSPCASATTCCL